MSNREPFHDWPTVMSTLVAGGDLDSATAGSVMTTILRGDATAAQIETLGETIRKRVRETSGVELEWEIKRIGLEADTGGAR